MLQSPTHYLNCILLTSQLSSGYSCSPIPHHGFCSPTSVENKRCAFKATSLCRVMPQLHLRAAHLKLNGPRYVAQHHLTQDERVPACTDTSGFHSSMLKALLIQSVHDLMKYLMSLQADGLGMIPEGAKKQMELAALCGIASGPTKQSIRICQETPREAVLLPRNLGRILTTKAMSGWFWLILVGYQGLLDSERTIVLFCGLTIATLHLRRPFEELKVATKPASHVHQEGIHWPEKLPNSVVQGIARNLVWIFNSINKQVIHVLLPGC